MFTASSDPDEAPRLAEVRVCVDTRRRPAWSSGGVGVYAEVLAQTLRRLGAKVEPLNERENVDGAPEWLKRPKRWAAATRRGERRLAPDGQGDGRGWIGEDLFRQAQVHFNLYGRLMPLHCPDPPAVMHWSYPLPMRMAGARNVYTVHDLIPLEHPELTGIDRRRHQRLLDRVNEAADRIFTVSEHSQAALMRHLDRPAEFVVNTYQAVSPSPPAAAPLPEGLVEGGYFLFCGSVEPRKNLARLITAHRRSGAPQPLVIAGPDGWNAGSELPTAALDGRAIRLAWLERPALETLIGKAAALLFPSLAEGFGLPVLEAMTFGVPVMTSNRDALAEIAANGALQVDPTDIDAMAAAIGTLSRDQALRSQLSKAGRRRSEAFSQGAYARRLGDAYVELLRPKLPAIRATSR